MGWGPDDRPAAVSVVFESLTAGGDLEAGLDEPSVTPALPTILRALGDRAIRATFLVSRAVSAKEPLALTMVENGAHEVGLLPYEGPASVRDAPFLFRGANALHQALQVAIANGLQDREHTILVFTPGLLERQDSLAVFVETLELIEGLREAERLWVPTLGELRG